MNEYLTTGQIGSWFNRSYRAVLNWISRYEDFPKPDLVIPTSKGLARYWLPEREEEIRQWHTTLGNYRTKSDRS